MKFRPNYPIVCLPHKTTIPTTKHSQPGIVSRIWISEETFVTAKRKFSDLRERAHILDAQNPKSLNAKRELVKVLKEWGRWQ